MVWKKDLAKLKEELKKEGPSAPPPPKPAPKKPTAPLDLGGEDAMFLAAMGLRPAQPRLPNVLPAAEPPKPAEVPQPAPAEPNFQEAMASLKGLKRTPPPQPLSAEPSVRPTASPKPAIPSSLPKVQEDKPATSPAPATPTSAPEPSKKEPLLIQLAAGMAIEVDGVLDLRGHSRADALERLKERVMDGQALGWRTFHVIFGSSETLAEAFLDFLKSPEASVLARYAQAPIPMGGSQARILYYAGPGTTTKETP